MSKILKAELTNRSEREFLLGEIVKIIHFLGNSIELSDPKEITSSDQFSNNETFVLIKKDGTEYHCRSALGVYDEEEIHLQEDAEYYCRKALKDIQNGDFTRALSNLRTSESTINRIINPHE